MAALTSGEAMARAAARARGGEHRLDVWNHAVVGRPVESFAALTDGLALPFAAGPRAAIEHNARRNARGAFGAHRCSAGECGLTRASIGAAFEKYFARFDRGARSAEMTPDMPMLEDHAQP